MNESKDFFTAKLLEGKDKDLSEPENHDDRHNVSDRMMDTLEEVAYNQDDYGIKKYKVALHHSHKYDWLAMFFEEIADGLKYLQNEMDRRAVVKRYLQTALEIRDWHMVHNALDLLEIEGTGIAKESKKIFSVGDLVEITDAMDGNWIGKKGKIRKVINHTGELLCYTLDVGGGYWPHSSLKRTHS